MTNFGATPQVLTKQPNPSQYLRKGEASEPGRQDLNSLNRAEDLFQLHVAKLLNQRSLRLLTAKMLDPSLPRKRCNCRSMWIMMDHIYIYIYIHSFSSMNMKLVKASVLHHLWKAHFVTGSIRNLGQLARLHCTSRCGLPAVGSVGMKMPTAWCS